MELDKDFDAYIREWVKTQFNIWKEKIERFGIIRTGTLHESFESALENTAAGKTIEMKFAQYGIYQELGVGYGYKHDNPGDLPFLDKEFRAEHRLDVPRKVGPAWGGYVTSGRPRKRRGWFSRKLYMSVMSMQEDLARITGEEMASVVCNALADSRGAIVEK